VQGRVAFQKPGGEMSAHPPCCDYVLPMKTAPSSSTAWSVIRLLTALACVTTYMLVTGVV